MLRGGTRRLEEGVRHAQRENIVLWLLARVGGARRKCSRPHRDQLTWARVDSDSEGGVHGGAAGGGELAILGSAGNVMDDADLGEGIAKINENVPVL